MINEDEEIVRSYVMRVARNAMRSTLIAPPGKKLVVADLSNIEGRGAAWLAQEQWKLDAFREFDAGKGADLYKVSYAKAFNTSPDFDHKTIEGNLKRQIGKVQELMLQYEGGVGAWITGAATYRIDLDELAEKAGPTIPGDVWAEAEKMWNWTLDEGRQTYGLHKDVFMVCDSLKRLWRRGHPHISSFWKELKNAVIDAIESPGATLVCRTLKINRSGSWLRIQLPSGAYLCYPFPRVANDGTISYMGMNQYTHRWSRITTYGGKLLENATQSFAGDVLKYNMPTAELWASTSGDDILIQKSPLTDDGIVLTVHDEMVIETPDTKEFTSDALAGIMATVPSWAPGLPLAAAGFETYRYRKE